MRKIFCSLLIIILIITNGCGANNSESLDDLLELGQKYLLEENYDEAVIAFEKAIIIDEKCVIAYIGLADSYVGKGNNDKALEVLERGYKITGEDELNEKYLDMMKNTTTSEIASPEVEDNTAPVNGTNAGTDAVVVADGPKAIGDSYQGGKIVYIDGTGQHGLIAAPSDQSTGDEVAIVWHTTCDGVTGAIGIALGTGNANTNAIIAVYGTENNAAKLCADLVLGGYSDWYLPSKDELNQLYLNKGAVGGFASVYYWSSTEYDNYDAWMQDFANGNQYCYLKYQTTCVRAVRAF